MRLYDKTPLHQLSLSLAFSYVAIFLAANVISSGSCTPVYHLTAATGGVLPPENQRSVSCWKRPASASKPVSPGSLWLMKPMLARASYRSWHWQPDSLPHESLPGLAVCVSIEDLLVATLNTGQQSFTPQRCVCVRVHACVYVYWVIVTHGVDLPWTRAPVNGWWSERAKVLLDKCKDLQW